MNLAPYLAAMQHSMALITDKNAESAARFIRDKLAEKPLVPPVTPLETILKPGVSQFPVSLYSVASSALEKLIAGVPQTPSPGKLPAQFVRAIPVENEDQILLFPDDDSPEWNITHFFLTRSSASTITFNYFRNWQLGGRSSLSDAIEANAVNDMGCNLAVSGGFPSMQFMCNRTWCTHQCNLATQVEYERVRTVICKCEH
jgi:hypothetical protein